MVGSRTFAMAAAAGALVCGCWCARAAGQDLVVNGGFETGSFFPWIAPGPVFPPNPDPQLFSISSLGGHDGPHYARLSSTQLRFMHQFLPTAAGQDYELSFWLRKPINSPSQFYIRWEGEFVYSQATQLPDGTNWHRLTLPVHSDFNGSLLEFGQDIFPAEYHIDDISVVPVPAPGGMVVMALGGAVVMRRGR